MAYCINSDSKSERLDASGWPKKAGIGDLGRGAAAEELSFLSNGRFVDKKHLHASKKFDDFQLGALKSTAKRQI